ncbi:MAG: twin-arginine translocation signal domain-containing protein, partial [Candidatus Rokubacteria bacterium]|nr:twin-arginine translocation signal domain-containing protein [Candidatus Rokubacteria bacterium]
MTNDRRIRQKSQRTLEASRGVNGISRRRFLTLATGTGVALSAAATGPWVHAASPGGIELTTFGAPGGFGPPAARAIEVFNQRNEGKIRVRSVVVPFDVHFEKQMTELVTKST